MATRGFVPGVSEGILMVCTLIPAVTYTLIFLLYQFGYPLTKKRLEEAKMMKKLGLSMRGDDRAAFAWREWQKRREN